MKKNEIREELILCGVARNEYDDIVSVYCKEYENGTIELLYNNDPYGIVSIYGSINEHLQQIAKYEQIRNEKGDPIFSRSELYQTLITFLTEMQRGKATAVLVAEEGFLFIKDFEGMLVELQPFQYGSKENKMLKYTVDITNCEDDSDVYEEFILKLEENLE